ncbi:MAG: hypothetical protein ACI4EG_08385 [Fusicatenibacter sp.]|nr:hypothetical protein [Fusicatenibacter sp.]
MAKPMTTKDKIREWISDNLRYMMLIGGILLVVGFIALAVHLISGRGEEKPESKSFSTVSQSEESKGDSLGEAVTDESKDPDSETDSVSESGTESQGEPEDVLVFSADNQQDVSACMTSYFTALAAKDLDEIRRMSDQLSLEEEEKIAAEENVASYDKIETYTLEGPKSGTYIAFVKYECSYQGIETPLPMLNEVYVFENGDGNLVVMDDPDSDAEASVAMKEALERPEVKTLIEEVQSLYDQALSADADLKKYVDSIN